MMEQMLELMHNYLDRKDVIILMDEYWFMCQVERIAAENGYDLTDEELTDLVDILIEEY